MTSRVPLLMVIAVGLLFSIACGGGKVGGTNPTGPFTIGGSVTGLTGTGLVLQDNGGDDLTVSASGTFTFATTIAANGAYSVTVLTQPTNPTQTCTVANGSGTAAANVTNVAVTCTTATTTFNISGTLTGLSAGSSVVLQDNGTDNLTLTADGTFTFATKVTNYSVTVLTQPVNQACTVTNGGPAAATADVTNVQVLCAAPVTIGGTLTGLTTGGTVVLANNGTFDTLSLDTDGQFTFPRQLAAGSAYDVTVSTQPTGQTCTVTNASGTATTDVTNVTVTCGAQLFTIGGTITGLSGTVVLQDNGGDNLSLTADGTFTFSTGLALGSPYNVSRLHAARGSKLRGHLRQRDRECRRHYCSSHMCGALQSHAWRFRHWSDWNSHGSRRHWSTISANSGESNSKLLEPLQRRCDLLSQHCHAACGPDLQSGTQQQWCHPSEHRCDGDVRRGRQYVHHWRNFV